MLARLARTQGLTAAGSLIFRPVYAFWSNPVGHPDQQSGPDKAAKGQDCASQYCPAARFKPRAPHKNDFWQAEHLEEITRHLRGARMAICSLAYQEGANAYQADERGQAPKCGPAMTPLRRASRKMQKPDRYSRGEKAEQKQNHMNRSGRGYRDSAPRRFFQR